MGLLHIGDDPDDPRHAHMGEDEAMNPDTLMDLIPVIVAAGVLVSTIGYICKEEERRWIERVCIGGPL